MTPARWMRIEQDGRATLRAAAAGFARVQGARAAPALLWTRTEEGGVACALVAPRKFAPGRSTRWGAWALAPLVASYRAFGLRAWYEANAVWLSGAPVAVGEGFAAGACAVIAFQFLPLHRDFMEIFRHRIEAQQGWQFDNAWPSAEERAAIGDSLALESAGAAP